ncbi:hypothetical protein NY051_01805 [Corynebacterium diphtheriae bv. gravis]|nr:hypothetical protein NY051_01805 [Corynebacterium diphtheriae bv. gravis]
MTEKSQLPNFLTNASKHDWILWWAFALTGIYQLGLIPFRAVLLLNHTFLYAMLTGSGFSLVSLAASNPERIGFLCLSTVLAAASAIKFLPLFYLMGYRWGTEFLHYSFMGHPPTLVPRHRTLHLPLLLPHAGRSFYPLLPHPRSNPPRARRHQKK